MEILDVSSKTPKASNGLSAQPVLVFLNPLNAGPRRKGRLRPYDSEDPREANMNAHTPALTGTAQLPPVDARHLVADGTTRLIDLDGQIYTLRITRAGKLILTK